jgi:hypothetical protein
VLKQFAPHQVARLAEVGMRIGDGGVSPVDDPRKASVRAKDVPSVEIEVAPRLHPRIVARGTLHQGERRIGVDAPPGIARE